MTLLIMDRLKAETREAHLLTERTPFAQAMMRGTLTRSQYVAQLASFREVHRALEASLARSGERVSTVYRASMAKAALLERDLAFLGAPERRAAVLTAVEARIEGDFRRQEDDPASLFGSLYVLEGSGLGAAFLLPRIQSQLALAEEGTRYYAGYGAAVLDQWRAFGRRMNEALRAREEQDRAVEATGLLFARIGDLFRGLSRGGGDANPSPSPHRREALGPKA